MKTKMAMRGAFVQAQASARKTAAVAQQAAKKHATPPRNPKKALELDAAAIRKRTAAEDAHTRSVLRNIKRESAARHAAHQSQLQNMRSRSAQRTKTMNRIGSGAARAAIGGIGLIGAGATRLVGGAVRESISLQDKAVDIAVMGRAPGERINPKALAAGFQETALSVPGAKPEEIAAAVESFVQKTGDLKTALSQQEQMATLMVATGTNAKELGTLMAIAVENMNVPAKDLMKTVSAMVIQGKKSNVELPDMAKHIGLIASASAAVGQTTGAEGLRKLGGLFQLAEKGIRDPARTATGLRNLILDLQAKAPELKKKLGVDVLQEDGKSLKDLDVIIPELLRATRGDASRLTRGTATDVRFDKRAFAVLLQPMKIFKDEMERTNGDANKATQAVVKEIARLSETSNAENEVRQDAADKGKKTSSQLSDVWNKLVKEVGGELTPKLVEIVGKISKMATETDVFESLVTVFSALADAAQIAIDALVSIGLLKKKEASPEEMRDEALRAMQASQIKLNPIIEKARRGEELSAIDQSILKKEGKNQAQASLDLLAANTLAEKEARFGREGLGGKEFRKEFAEGEGEESLLPTLGKGVFSGAFGGVSGLGAAALGIGDVKAQVAQALIEVSPELGKAAVLATAESRQQEVAVEAFASGGSEKKLSDGADSIAGSLEGIAAKLSAIAIPTVFGTDTD